MVLVLTNTMEVGVALLRFIKFTFSEIHNNSFLTFSDLRMMSRDILNAEFLIVEAVNIEKDSLENRRVEFLLSFNRIGKKVLLLYLNGVSVPLTHNLKKIMLKLPYEIAELKDRIAQLLETELVVLNEQDRRILEQMFPYKTEKDHHHHSKGIVE